MRFVGGDNVRGTRWTRTPSSAHAIAPSSSGTQTNPGLGGDQAFAASLTRRSFCKRSDSGTTAVRLVTTLGNPGSHGIRAATIRSVRPRRSLPWLIEARSCAALIARRAGSSAIEEQIGHGKAHHDGSRIGLHELSQENIRSPEHGQSNTASRLCSHLPRSRRRSAGSVSRADMAGLTRRREIRSSQAWRRAPLPDRYRLAGRRPLGVLRPSGEDRSVLGFGKPFVLPSGDRRDVQHHRGSEVRHLVRGVCPGADPREPPGSRHGHHHRRRRPQSRPR